MVPQCNIGLFVNEYRGYWKRESVEFQTFSTCECIQNYLGPPSPRVRGWRFIWLVLAKIYEMC